MSCRRQGNPAALRVCPALLLLLLVLPFTSATNYWWKLPKQDCGYDDVAPQPACGHAGKGDVTALKACCLATKACGGFNTNGIIKKTDCLSNAKPEPACDLYVLQTKPQPPPPPPAFNWPPIWPLPASVTNGTNAVAVDAKGFHFAPDANAGTSATLAAAFERYTKLAFPHETPATSLMSGAGALLSTVDVSLAAPADDSTYPQLGDDESYTLVIGADGSASLSAKTVWGAMHGLETLAQLIVFDFDAKSYTIPAAPWTIEDAPRFPHRGLMIDTARHFEPLSAIRSMIDSLPYAKLNVLHWHVVDSQSFPLESKTHPKLWDGAYSGVEKYTQADVAGIVEYARARGVRVMVEFDVPGHAASWCSGYPDICPSPTCTQPLNVANNGTFDLIQDLLGEMTGHKASAPGAPSGLFPINMIHLGGDEVDTSCWTKTPSIASWLASRNMSADDGYAYFVKKAADMAISQGRRPVQWVEVFDHFGSALAKETIVHVWKDKSTLPSVVSKGYNALINNSPGSDSWYLDHLDITWDAVYGNEPCADIPDQKECDLVLGGQGEMWGETVDASDFQPTVWPKLAAIAERLWSPREAIKDTQAAVARLQAFRCLLNRRGVAAAPVLNKGARSSPPAPGGCLTQR